MNENDKFKKLSEFNFSIFKKYKHKIFYNDEIDNSMTVYTDYKAKASKDVSEAYTDDLIIDHMANENSNRNPHFYGNEYYSPITFEDCYKAPEIISLQLFRAMLSEDRIGATT